MSKWIYKGEIIDSIDKLPENAIGFIYLLTCASGEHIYRKYLGKKLLYSERKKILTKKEIALLPNKRLKKYRIIKSESNWKEYMSSSDEVKALHAQGIEFSKEILYFCYSKTELTYKETQELFCRGCIESDDWFNITILNSFYKGNLGNKNEEL